MHVVKAFIYELDVSYAPTCISATGQSDMHCKIEETLLICDLKGHCHEGFVVLDEFCTKIITLRL